MMSNDIFWLLELAVKEGKPEELKKLMGDMVSYVNQNEPDTLNYEWFINDDGGTCHIHERYKDSAAVLVHLKGFGENFAERFMACFDFTRFTIYGSPDTGVKEALAPFSPKYMPPSAGFAR